MPTDTEALVVSLEARIRDFERNFQRAQRTADRSFRAIEQQGDDAARRLEQSMTRAAKGVTSGLATIGKGLAAGALGGLAVASLDQVVDRLGRVVRGVADVGREARRAGVSATAFQELSAVADRARIPVDSLVDGLKELSLRADEFVVTGGGSAAEAFARLGFGAADLKRALEEPADLMVEIIGRMEQLDRAAQIRVADELFGGTAGERFVELLGMGEAGIRQIIEEAHDLGQVLDDELVAKAEEIDAQFAKIGRTVSTNVKREIVETVVAIDQLLDRFRKIEDRGDRTIQARLSRIYVRQAELRDALDASEGNRRGGGGRANMMRELEELTDEALRLRDVLDRRDGYPGAESAGDAASDATPKVQGLGDATDGAGRSATSTRPDLDALATAAAGAGTGGKSGAEGFTSFADAVRALKDEIPGLASELAQLDAAARIDEAYRGGLRNARSIGEAMNAEALRNEAMAALDVQRATGDSAAFLKTKLTSGKSHEHVDGLTGTFADKLATMLASAPDDIKGQISIYSGFRSFERQAQLFEAAKRKYGSEAAARKWVAPPGNSQHNKGNAADLKYGSDTARTWVHRNAERFGLAFPMGHEPWHIEDAGARRKLDDDTFRDRYEANRRAEQERRRATERKAEDDKRDADRKAEQARREAERAKEQAAREKDRAAREAAQVRERATEDAAREAERVAEERKRAAEDKAAEVERERQERVDEATRQTEAYRSIIEGSKAFVSTQGVERTALTMTATNAAALRHEHQMLAEAQRAGLTLTQQQRDEIAKLAQGMAQAEEDVSSYAETQQQANEVSKFFGSQAVDALSGILTGTMTAEQALQNLVQTLIKAALQAAILGEGPLASLFKGGGKIGVGGGGAKGKAGGGFLGALLGFADGGHVRGPGTSRSDSIPARLSNGEFVVNAAATRRHRATLEAINAGRVPTFADGGMVGTAPPRLAGPNVSSSSSSSVTINAPIKVEGSSGTPEQNADLAKQMRRELEGTMRGIVVDELRQQSRVGNMLARR